MALTWFVWISKIKLFALEWPPSSRPGLHSCPSDNLHLHLWAQKAEHVSHYLSSECVGFFWPLSNSRAASEPSDKHLLWGMQHEQISSPAISSQWIMQHSLRGRCQGWEGESLPWMLWWAFQHKVRDESNRYMWQNYTSYCVLKERGTFLLSQITDRFSFFLYPYS